MVLSKKLAILGGQPTLPGGPVYRSPFAQDIYPKIETLLRDRPLSTLFGEHDVEEFENKFSSLLNIGCAVAVNSGTSALHTSLVAAGITSLDEVAVTCFSFIASASVILQVGAKPIFIDIEKDNLALDLNDLKRKITSKTRAVIVAHLFGIPANIIEISNFCKENNLILIEDSCQALGACVDGKAIGTFGDIGCFSFNVKKVIQTGEGGMLVCHNEEIAQIARELRVNGLSRFSVERVGFNYTLTNFQACIGSYQLDHLKEIVLKRKSYSEIIQYTLSKYVKTFNEYRDSYEQSYYAVPFLVLTEKREERDILLAALNKEGVPVSGVYDVLYHHTQVFGPHTGEICNVAESIIPRLLSINPSHLYTEEDIELICGGIDKVFSQSDELKQLVYDI